MDADLLSELWSQGRVDDRWWQAWLTPLEVCDQREWLRYRMSLAGIQPRVKIRIHATLHRHGVLNEFSDLFGKEGQAFLQELNADEEITLRRSGKLTLKRHLKLLDQVPSGHSPSMIMQLSFATKIQPESSHVTLNPSTST